MYGEKAVVVPRQMLSILVLFQAVANALNTAGLSMVSQYVGSKAYKERVFQPRIFSRWPAYSAAP